MRTSGAFRTSASTAQLRELVGVPGVLATVPTLHEVVRRSPDTISTVFTPRIGLGPFPLSTTIVTTSEAEHRVELAVRGRRGSQVVDVALVIELGDVEGGTAVSWTADVALRGVVASVGQRVGQDLATRAIGELLAAVAAAVVGASV